MPAPISNSGVVALGESSSGPWVWNRILAVWRIGSDRGAEHIAERTMACLRAHAGDDEEVFAHVSSIVRFYAHDNASDENKVARILSELTPCLVVWQRLKSRRVALDHAALACGGPAPC